MAVAVSSGVSAARRYRFAGVVVDEGATRLEVDGRPCRCSQRALHLLLIFCESPGRTLGRAELMDRLWPGGQLVADEALTQAVFRARAVLGAHAGHIVTIRGAGFRLDADVVRLGVDGDADEVVQPSAYDEPAATGTEHVDPVLPSKPAEPPSGRMMRRLPYLLALLAALLLAAFVYRWAVAPKLVPTDIIDVGYALKAPDLHATQADTARLIADAFRREGEGDRARARALLETVYSSDATTPVPAIFLALWAVGGGNNAEADRWLMQAQLRTDRLDDAYLGALLAYVEAERRGQPQEILRRAGALLDLRPDAWQLRLARSHLMLYSGYRDAAAAELARLDFGDLHHRKQVMALADRASLGDADGAAAVLADLDAKGLADTPRIDYLRGRIAWSQKDYARAKQDFLRCEDRGRREARFDLVNRCAANVGAIAVVDGDYPNAIELLERALAGMQESGWRRDEVDLGLMLAQLYAFSGNTDASRQALASAQAVAGRSEVDSMWAWVRLYELRLSDADLPDISLPANVVTPTGLVALLDARAAYRRGDIGAARQAYERALRATSQSDEWIDELSLLGWELRREGADDGQDLGAPVDLSEIIDPPYPPLARLTSRALLQRAMETSP